MVMRKYISKGNIWVIFFFCLYVLLLMAPFPAEAQERAASLVIEPAKGREAAIIKIKGAKFQPSEEVDIIMQVGHVYHGLGTAKTDVVVADGKGEFDVTTGIPVDTPPGVYKIEATGNKGSLASANLEVMK